MSSTADCSRNSAIGIENNPTAQTNVLTALRSQNTAISNLVTAQSATNATLRSNGTFLWCALFIAVLAFIQSCVALYIAQRICTVVEEHYRIFTGVCYGK